MTISSRSTHTKRSSWSTPAHASSDTLAIYLRQINGTALLTAEQERQLCTRIADGDEAAREEMVLANLRLVVSIARNFAGRGLSLMDLIEEGNLGLIRATEGFDTGFKTRFSTYASYWIKQSIRRALVNQAPSIRLPAYMVELLCKWHQAERLLASSQGTPPTPEEIAKELGLPKKKTQIVMKALKAQSMRQWCPEVGSRGDDDTNSMDTIADRSSDGVIDPGDLERALRLLDTLDERKATILRMRFGIGDFEPMTLKEIGEHLGITRERVRQLEAAALAELTQKF